MVVFLIFLAPTLILDSIGDYDIFVFIFGLIIFGFSAYYLWLTRHYMDRFEEIISTSSKESSKELDRNRADCSLSASKKSTEKE